MHYFYAIKYIHSLASIITLLITQNLIIDWPRQLQKLISAPVYTLQARTSGKTVGVSLDQAWKPVKSRAVAEGPRTSRGGMSTLNKKSTICLF